MYQNLYTEKNIEDDEECFECSFPLINEIGYISENNRYLCQNCYNRLPKLIRGNVDSNITQIDYVHCYCRYGCNCRKIECVLCEKDLIDELIGSEWGSKKYYSGHRFYLDETAGALCNLCYENLTNH
jgi:hypothetical protein